MKGALRGGKVPQGPLWEHPRHPFQRNAFQKGAAILMRLHLAEMNQLVSRLLPFSARQNTFTHAALKLSALRRLGRMLVLDHAEASCSDFCKTFL